MVSWRPDLHDTINIQQLWWQNFCSRWTSFSGTLYRSNCVIQTSLTSSAEGTPFGDFWYVAPKKKKHLLTYFCARHSVPRFLLGVGWGYCPQYSPQNRPCQHSVYESVMLLCYSIDSSDYYPIHHRRLVPRLLHHLSVSQLFSRLSLCAIYTITLAFLGRFLYLGPTANRNQYSRKTLTLLI